MPTPTPRHALPGLAAVALAAALSAAPAGGQAQAAPAAGRIHHSMVVGLDPATHALTVTDTVTLPSRPAGGVVDFVLNGALRVSESDPPVREVPIGTDARFQGINGSGEAAQRQVGLKRYRATLASGQATLRLVYAGAVEFGLSDQKEEYTRGFRESAGMLGAEGVYLTGASFWYPSFDSRLVDFDLDVAEPAGWQVISQGNGTSRGDDGHARWTSGGPMDEIDLVGGPLHVWRGRAGTVETLVYLHDRDEALAARYLAATSQYLRMYADLIAPYPYGKFALVENFWETGYGMPTFTLLGHDIIRFPFIITSSYPHEILHNWWGNSVFVDYESGNWCEGLTAYLADHLIQEQLGAGDQYRRSTLQKYRDYVRAGRDFPLTAFGSRESASTEAVGYGKALMVYHMLHMELGDDVFRQVLRTFYHDFEGKRASFADFERTVDRVTGRDWRWFFAEWVERPGAPALSAEVTAVKPDAAHAGQFIVEGTLRQAQGGAPYVVSVPIVVQTAEVITRQVVRLKTAEQRFEITSPDIPLAVHVDPYFDVFRKLDPRETPPSIGQIFGESRVLAILPSKAPEPEIQAWRALFESWRSESHAVDVKLDSEVADLPADRAVWIAGFSNLWVPRLYGGNRGDFTVAGPTVQIDGMSMPAAKAAFVVATRHPGNVEKAVGFIGTDLPGSLPALGRKLPHYGKYSYLVFEGEAANNSLKGQWQSSDSPLDIDVRALSAAAAGMAEADLPAAPTLPPDARKPLVELPPARPAGQPGGTK